jgi:hypothetical protein
MCLGWPSSSKDSTHSTVACLLQAHTGHYSRTTVVYCGSYCSYGCPTEERVVATVGYIMGEYPTRLPRLYSLPRLCTSRRIFLMRNLLYTLRMGIPRGKLMPSSFSHPCMFHPSKYYSSIFTVVKSLTFVTAICFKSAVTVK